MADIRKILDDLFDSYTLVANGNYVSLYDLKGHTIRCSPAAVDLFGLPGEYMEESTFDWADYVHPEDLARYEDMMGGLLAGIASAYNITYRVRLADGDYGRFRFIGSVLKDELDMPELIGGIIVNEGVTEHTDPITVLRNQDGFFADLATVIKQKREHLVLLIGLEGMGAINEKQGYGFGNHVLQQVGWVLQECAGEDGIVYRMNGAKFAILTDHNSSMRMQAVYDMIRQKLQSGVMVGNVKQTLNVCGGLISTGEQNAWVNERTIYSCLKYVFNLSRHRKRGALVNFDGGREGGQRKLQLIDEVRDCIVRDCSGFTLVYQPVFDSSTEKILGAEALLRWESDRYGEVAPMEYIPVIERDYVFEELGFWVLSRAMMDTAAFMEKNPDFVVGVNMAAVQLEDDLFVDELVEIAEETGFSLSNLCLELTGDCRQLRLELLQEVVSKLREKGVRFIMDDFGAGSASIEYLRQLPVEYVKLDMQYVRELETKEEDRQILSYLSGLVGVCGSKTCVKGIETEGMRKIVKDCDVQMVQGFAYAKPMGAEELLDRFLK